MSAQANQIATQFITTYYQLFDSDRSQLASLYRQESVLLFEGNSFAGQQAIIEKLTSLPFQQVQHAVTTKDAVLTIDGSLLVVVTGQLKTDNDPVHPFTQSFYLKQIGDSLFIFNDIFRLSLHNIA